MSGRTRAERRGEVAPAWRSRLAAPTTFVGASRVVTSFGYYLTVPLLAVVALRVGGMSAAEIGVLVAVQAVCRRGLAVPAGMLCDRWGGERVLLAGLVAEAVGYLVLASSVSFSAWLVGLALDGLGGCAYNAAGKVVVARASAAGRGAVSFVGFYVATSVGALFGPLAAALLATASPRAVLLLSAAVYVLAAVAAAVRFRTADRTRPSPPAAAAWTAAVAPVLNRTFLGYCLLVTPLWFGSSLLVSGVPLEATGRGLGYVTVGALNAGNALLMIVLGRRVARRTDGAGVRRRAAVLGAGAVAMAASCLLCLPAPVPFLYLAVGVLTLGELALVAAADAVAVHFAPAGTTGTYLGWVTTAWAAGGVLAGLLAGALLHGSPAGRLAFWAGSAGLLTLDAAGWYAFTRLRALPTGDREDSQVL